MSVHESMVSTQFHQLPMFMSAREIHEGWKLNEPDRYGVDAKGKTTWPSQKKPTRPESDAEFWGRKSRESDQPDPVFNDEKQVWEPGTQTLRKSVVANGVESPVRLQDPGSAVFGRPSIIGGHHRIAVMTEHKPDALMPVLFDHDINDAYWDKAYPYT